MRELLAKRASRLLGGVGATLAVCTSRGINGAVVSAAIRAREALQSVDTQNWETPALFFPDRGGVRVKAHPERYCSQRGSMGKHTRSASWERHSAGRNRDSEREGDQKQ